MSILPDPVATIPTRHGDIELFTRDQMNLYIGHVMEGDFVNSLVRDGARYRAWRKRGVIDPIHNGTVLRGEEFDRRSDSILNERSEPSS